MPRNNLAFYDQQAPQWWDETSTIFPLSKLNPLRFDYFDGAVPDWGGLKVLDVGCGGGYTCEFLARRGAIVTGIDQSADCIKAAQAHSLQSGLTIAYHDGYAECLPFAADSFDGVVCVDVLEHVANPAQTVAEISRVLKPGGLFCFDTINRTWQSRLVMIWLLENWLGQIPRGVHDWRKFLPPQTLCRYLHQTGFDAVTLDGFDLFGRNPIEQIRRLSYFWRTGEFRAECDRHTSIMYIGTARKR
ncbi:3-demethylubiquinone-9 3-O-methyltransferase [filamentous cyanobacterium CCP5]|nr:3-demethylubiquinone-9 3-O-methyltransferase [filamentous cyanobacterium CCP5]